MEGKDALPLLKILFSNMTLFYRNVLLDLYSVSVQTDRRRRRQWRPFGFKSSHMDPRPEGHHVHDLHLRVHPHMEEASLPRLRKGPRHILGLSFTVIKSASDNPHHLSDRWYVRPAPPISTTWSTWRTNRLACATTASQSFRKTVSDQEGFLE